MIKIFLIEVDNVGMDFDGLMILPGKENMEYFSKEQDAVMDSAKIMWDNKKARHRSDDLVELQEHSVIFQSEINGSGIHHLQSRC